VPAPAFFGGANNIGRLKPVFIQLAVDGEYRLIDDADGRMSVLLVAGMGAATPAAVVIPLDMKFPSRIEAALRLWRLATGQPRRCATKPIASQRRRRLALTLRALDGHLEGATYRNVASALFDATRVPADRTWKTHDIRDRTIRLVRAGLHLMQGGYLSLLCYPHRRRRE
jgi:hypothetical protein